MGLLLTIIPDPAHAHHVFHPSAEVFDPGHVRSWRSQLGGNSLRRRPRLFD